MFRKAICAAVALAAIFAAGRLPEYILENAHSLPVALPHTVEYRPFITATGVLEARESYDLIAAGTYLIGEVYCSAGDMVSAGDVIAELSQAQGAVYNIASGATGGVEASALEAYAAQYGVDISEVMGGFLGGSASTVVEQSEHIISPIDGVIISDILPSGSVAASGSLICTVQSAQGHRAVVQVPEKKISEVAVGSEAEVIVTGAGESVSGWVSRIYPTAAASISGASYATTVSVEISFYDLPQSVRAGNTVSAAIYTSAAQTLVTVPYEAVMQDDITGTEYVLLAAQGGYERRDIITGREFADSVEVVSGLELCEAVLEVSGMAPDIDKPYILEVD